MFFGEISLSGDIRPVPQAEARLKEAAKLGFKQAFIPKGTKVEGAGLKLTEMTSVADLLAFARGRQARAGKMPVAVVESSEGHRSAKLLNSIMVLPIDLLVVLVRAWCVRRLRRLARLPVGDAVDLRLGGGGLRHALFRPLADSPDAGRDRHALDGIAGGLCRHLPGGADSAVLHRPSFFRDCETFAHRAAGPGAGHRLRRGPRVW